MADKLEIVIVGKDQASGTFKKITSVLGGLGTFAAGTALAGVTAIGAGLVTAGVSGLGFNNSMELVEAQLNAFTKDGSKTAEILEMIQKRAAKTPFEFEEMAKAASALLPSAKQAQTGLEGLIEQAEILAASNPAQGLEGAAFALKEAVSGDFTSIIERFNLPRQFINQLKAEGVPALEIVSRAMQEMGLDTSLVANLAETASGRWSTLKDNFTTLAATITKPIFEAFSSGLGVVNQLLTDNEPVLKALAEQLAGGIQSAINWIINTGIPGLQRFANWFMQVGWPTIQPFIPLILSLVSPIAFLATAWLQNWGDIQGKTTAVLNFLKPYWDDLKKVFNNFIALLLPELKKVWLELQAVWKDSIQPALAELMVSLKQLATELGLDTGKTDFWKIALGALKIILAGVIITIRTLTPIIRALGEVIQFGIGNVNRFVNMLKSMKNAASNLIGVLRDIRNKIQDVINAASSMPSWLIPGSPTPFELGIRGIADAVKSLPQLELPNIAGNTLGAISPMATPAMAGGSGLVINVQYEYKPMISTADKIEMERNLSEVVGQIIRRYNSFRR